MSIFGLFLVIFGCFLIFSAIFFFEKKISLFFRFSIFFSGFSLIIFTIFPWFLSWTARLFWLERGAYLLMYVSVAFLFYLMLFLFRKVILLNEKLTHTIRSISLFSAQNVPKISGKIALVMACYNEEKILEKTLHHIATFDKNLIIIAINDGSRDATSNILQKFAKNNPRLIVLNHLENLGQWAALETGFSYIRSGKVEAEFVATFDADGQMCIQDVWKMCEFLQKNANIDIVLWSRFLWENAINMPFFRKMILKIGVIFTRFFSKIRLTDTHNGFRLMRRKVLDVMRISLDGMGHASEILDIIAKEKIAFFEMPVTIQYTEYSLQKGQNTKNSVKIALQMIFKNFF